MSEFSQWLDETLIRRRMSLRMLAVRSGVDKATISRVRRGLRDPRLETASALCAALREEYVIGSRSEFYTPIPPALTDAQTTLRDTPTVIRGVA